MSEIDLSSPLNYGHGTPGKFVYGDLSLPISSLFPFDFFLFWTIDHIAYLINARRQPTLHMVGPAGLYQSKVYSSNIECSNSIYI